MRGRNCRPMGRSPAPNRIGDLYCPARRVARGPVLSAGPLLPDSPGIFYRPCEVVVRFRSSSVPAWRMHQGNHGDRAGCPPGVRRHLPGGLDWRGVAAAMGDVPCDGGNLDSTGLPYRCRRLAPGTAGFGLPVTVAQYARTQLVAIAHYLRLAFWPSGLCIDYGWPVASGEAAILPGILVAALAAATVLAAWKRPKWAFAGIWFFAILVPTSSIVPVRDLAFEHRMYLPLAAVVAMVVVGGATLLARIARILDGRRTAEDSLPEAAAPESRTCAGAFLAVVPALAVAAMLAAATIARNRDYGSALAMRGRPSTPPRTMPERITISGTCCWRPVRPTVRSRSIAWPSSVATQRHILAAPRRSSTPGDSTTPLATATPPLKRCPHSPWRTTIAAWPSPARASSSTPCATSTPPFAWTVISSTPISIAPSRTPRRENTSARSAIMTK